MADLRHRHSGPEEGPGRLARLEEAAFKRDPGLASGRDAQYGIGQGYINVNALQLAVMTARLANGRKALNPRLIKSVGGVEQPQRRAVPDLPFSRSIWRSCAAAWRRWPTT
jgi:cell division protein FtsI/penicillin-binding protein 2